MRPIKLVMSAFGSYADVETIDFAIIKNGLFLITGDTGAGKTTIFDAITYALYDRTSGGKRDGNMMRSQYAKEDTDTYVEYTFSYRGKEYTVRRNPEYQRVPKRRKADGSNRLVRQSANVSLLLPDGRQYAGKKKEIDAYIEEIIGLDVSQFTQISMIAQGDFLKLLHAGSKERKRIFSRIFQTSLYWKIQEEFKEEAKQLTVRMQDNTKDCQREMERVELLPDCPEAEQWQCLQQLSLPPETEVQAILQKICAAGKQKEKTVEAEATALQRKAEEGNAVIRSQEEVNRLFLQRQQTEERLKALAKEKQAMLLAGQQAKEGARAERIAIREEQWNRTAKETKNIEESVKITRKWLVDKEEESTALQVSFKELEEELVSLEPVLQKQILRLSDMIPRFDLINRLDMQYTKQSDRMQKILSVCSEAATEYEKIYGLFFEEQAGILAQGLEEGLACPVCGSTHHPHKAEASGSAPNQETVQLAKLQRDKKEAERAEIQEQFQQAKSNLDSERQILKEMILELQDFQSTQDIWVTEIGKDLTKAEASILLEQWEEKLQQKKMNFQKTELYLRKLVEAQKTKSGQLESQEKQLCQLHTKCKEEEEYFQEEIKKQQFASLEEYEHAKQWIPEYRKQAEKVQQYEVRCLEENTRYEMLRQQTQGKEQVNLEMQKQKLQEVLELYRVQKQSLLRFHSQNEKNKAALEKLEQYFEAKGGLTEQYEMVNNLSRTANGTLSGSIKLDLETYVQRKYFKQIIHAANQRLSKMTSNEFILQCREIKDLSSQGEAGLDLDVYHLVNNSVRDVKTLSGGESFMASLCMALGLADIVQNAAGAISLDTMFVDEGFGSLDDRARERAIQILQELAGEKGMVGIISHVNELKEQMEWKLTVEKTDCGSHTKWILE